MKIPNEIRDSARMMYLRGYSATEIAKHSGVSARTIYNWIDVGNWDEIKVDLTSQQILANRICELATREDKSTKEIKELESLAKVVSQFDVEAAKAEKIRAEAKRIEAEAACILEGKEIVNHSGNKPKRQSRGKKNQPKKNDVTDIDVSLFDKIANDNFFQYQLTWRDNLFHRNRFLLKSRQIGATYYFAFEAFEDAVKHGRNKIFLSASKAQAKVFKAYIIAFALEHFDLELKGGDEITLYKDGKVHANLYFLSTNAASAQSYTGDLYIDEVFWIPNYTKLELVAKGMASHQHWRRTYFSTPSSIQHPAYKQWTGERYNKKRKNKADFDFSDEQLLKGVMGADRVWRNKVTVKDAQAQGCNLFNIQELEDEHTTDEFKNLFMCVFIDDKQSVFPFSELQPCIVDAASLWIHVDPESDRPLGNRPAALGYDPSRLRDNAALSLLEMPLKPTVKWRLIEKQQFFNQSSEFQGARIKEYLERYNVVHIGIDTTGIGYGVYEEIESIPQVVPIHYTLDVKTALVMQAKRIIQGKRFQYDGAHTDVTQSFMQITQQTTAGNRVTYGASRTKETGHADIAWSIMHAFYAEVINAYVSDGDEHDHSMIVSC